MCLRSAVKTVLVIIGLSTTLSHVGLSSANPALLEAAAAGNLEAVQAEIAGGADVDFTVDNKKPKYGYLVSTPLENSASKGHTEVVELLLKSGATFRADKWYGLYAATGAGQQGYTEILAMLLDNANPGPAQLDYLFGPALIIAVRNDRVDATSLLLERGVSANWHTPGDHFPRPAILEAARFQRSEIFALLLEAGADPTPYPEILTLIAMRGGAAMVEHLINMGMDPNDGGDVGPPLSMTACVSTGSNPKKQAKINATVKVLLDAGSDVNAPARGRSPLFCATEDHNKPLIAMLQASDARNFETMGNKLKRLGWGALFMLGGH